MAEARAPWDAAGRYEASGLLAASIVPYHLITWDVTPQRAGSVLGLFGVYGMSILRPRVREGCRLWLPDVGAAVQVRLIVAVTVVVSVVLYPRFELPQMQIGKLLARPTPRTANAV